MLNENEVVNAVDEYLVRNGYQITQKLNTNEKGIDIKAKLDGKIVGIEAKGATSSKIGTNRYGEEFSRKQVRNHVSVAFYKCSEMITNELYDHIAMALPDNENHRNMIKKISGALSKLNIGVYWVDEKRVVKYETY